MRSVVGPGPVDLQLPEIGPEEARSAAECVEGGLIGYKSVDALQSLASELCGSEQSVAVSSGTAALHLAYMAVGVEAGSEVLMPALSFVASANAAMYCGAVPHFVDVFDLNIAPFKLRQYLGRIAERRDGGTYNRKTGRRISALTVVDLLGHPADMTAVAPIAEHYGLPIIEDAAQALGSRSGNAACGGRGSIGVLSFNKNKIVTTDGGGAVLTNDPFMAAKVWNLATTARLAHPWRMDHTELAWNYRMGNINAAVALPQLHRLDSIIAKKRRVAEKYAAAFAGVEGVELIREPTDCRSNYWLNAIMLDPLEWQRRDEVMAALHGEGIAVRTLFTPMFELPHLRTCPRDNLESTMYLWRRTICLPSSARLGES